MGDHGRLAKWGVRAAAVLFFIVGIAPLSYRYLSVAPDQLMVDLDVYRTAGEVVLSGRPVYHFLTQPPQLLPFTYPPFAAFPAIPLTWLPWPVVTKVWLVLIYAALLVTVVFSFRRFLDRMGSWKWLVTAMLAVACAYMMPISDQVRFGQVDLLLVCMCLVDSVAKRPRWPRGMLIGLATAIKLVPGVFLVYLWAARQKRQALTATLTAIYVTLCAVIILPRDSKDFWTSAIFDNSRVGNNAGTTNQSLEGALLRMYLPDTVTKLLWLAGIMVIGFIGFRYAVRAAQVGDVLSAVAISGLLAVLISPVAWIHHMAWIIVVLGALLRDGTDRRRRWVTLGVWLFYVVPIPWYGHNMHAAGIDPLGSIIQDSYGIGAFCLVILLGRWLPKPQPELPTNSHSDGVDTPREKESVDTLGR